MFACKKPVGDNQNLDPNNQKWYDFMSSKTGSWWKYGSRDGVSWERQARDRDTTMLGKRYRYYERRDDTSGSFEGEFFGKNNNFYLTLIDLDGNGTFIDYVYWKDSSTTGAAYTNTGQVSSVIGNVDVLVETNVAEDGLTMTFAGHTYSPVKHAHSEIFASATLVPKTHVGTLDIWFIKGLGIIKESADINILGQYTQQHTDSLIDYHIEP